VAVPLTALGNPERRGPEPRRDRLARAARRRGRAGGPRGAEDRNPEPGRRDRDRRRPRVHRRHRGPALPRVRRRDGAGAVVVPPARERPREPDDVHGPRRPPIRGDRRGGRRHLARAEPHAVRLGARLRGEVASGLQLAVPIRQEVPMPSFRVSLGPALLAGALAVAPAAADDVHDQHQHARPEKLGTVSFPTSCAPAVQARFVRAVALLHSFWYEEAEKAFGEVAAADPSCAIAQWGVAMSLYHPIWSPPTAAELK